MSGNFDDGKDEGALRTIGEVGKALGLKPHVLRYWEEQFPSLEPLKRSGNRRYYRPEDVALIETIDRLVNVEGYTLKGARTAIEKGRAQMEEPASQEGQEAQVDDTQPGADAPAADAPAKEAPSLEDALPDAVAEPDPAPQPEPGLEFEPEPEAMPMAGSQFGAGATERAPRSASAMVEGHGVPSEIIAELKDIRARLEAAIAA